MFRLWRILESKSVHDFVKCSCPNPLFLDGGNEYCRYGGKEEDRMQITEDDTMISRMHRSRLDDDPKNEDKPGRELLDMLDKELGKDR